jgi:hypothetical protein
MLQVPFPYDFTPAEIDEQRRWEKVQLDKEVKKRNKDNFKISLANIFKPSNHKIKLKAADRLGDHMRLYNAWINEQRKRGRVFRNKPRMRLPMEWLHPRF